MLSNFLISIEYYGEFCIKSDVVKVLVTSQKGKDESNREDLFQFFHSKVL